MDTPTARVSNSSMSTYASTVLRAARLASGSRFMHATRAQHREIAWLRHILAAQRGTV